ncbi:MAG: DMT family transporter [Thermoplasmata archaeon]|nr:DMT family transporter [Thermoplasmata archaeon]
MDMYIIGATAAVLTSGLWTINAVLFTSAGKRIGAISVNAWRILFAVLLLWATQAIIFGQFFPDASGEQWFWIGLSGVIGLGIGDFGLFASFVIIGTRRAVLVMSLSAIFASIAAFFLFDELLSILALVGISLTLSGVIIVLMEDGTKSDEKPLTKKKKKLGITLALVGAIGQGLGLAFLKKGMLLYPNSTGLQDVMSLAVTATLIRMMLGTIFVWAVIILWGKMPQLKRALKDRRGMKFVAVGSFIGPFAGVTLSTMAAYLVKVGIAQTLMSLMPIFIIPLVWVLYKQRTSWRGIVGAFVAVAGVAVLFLI